MDGFDLGTWSDFGVGVAGAMAALTGLLFVAVSINLERIIAAPNLPRLAGATLLLFSTVLVSAIALLIPGQHPRALGIELVVLGILAGIPLVYLQTRPPRITPQTPMWDWLATRLAPAVLVPGLILLAGVGLIASVAGSLYLVAAATLVAIIAGLLSAWILLVEIQR